LSEICIQLIYVLAMSLNFNSQRDRFAAAQAQGSNAALQATPA
jgi:hypothetical protein